MMFNLSARRNIKQSKMVRMWSSELFHESVHILIQGYLTRLFGTGVLSRTCDCTKVQKDLGSK